MKYSLPHRALRFATTSAYDPTLRVPGNFWVGHSVDQFRLHEPLDASHRQQEVVDAEAERTERATRSLPRDNAAHSDNAASFCGNPLSDEPGAVVIGAVKRFGLIGLVTCAASAGVARWWNSLSQRDH